jgi:hypothetical protein
MNFGAIELGFGQGFSKVGLSRLHQTSGKWPKKISQAMKPPGRFPEVCARVTFEKPGIRLALRRLRAEEDVVYTAPNRKRAASRCDNITRRLTLQTEATSVEGYRSLYPPYGMRIKSTAA